MTLSTRLAAVMVALVVVTAAALGLFVYHNVAAIALPRALDRIGTHARVIAAELEASAGRVRADALGFRSSNAVIDIMTAALNTGVDPAAEAIAAEWRRRLGLRFAAELAAKSDYAEFRLIGIADGGRELVRVDRSGAGNAIRVVPDAELERRGDRDYFKEAIGRRAGEVYVSPIDLDREGRTVGTPPAATLRAAVPVVAPDGKPFAIVVIDLDLRPTFARIRATEGDGMDVYVVNDSGDYLVHPDPAREFGFARGTRYRVQDDFPQLAEILEVDAPTTRLASDRDGGYFGVGLNAVRLGGGPRVTVIEAVPYATLMAAAISVRDSSIIGGLAAVLCALVLAIIVARSLTRPLVRIKEAADGFARGETIAVPTAATGEIGALARAFTHMATEVRDKTAALRQENEERSRIFETSVDLILVTNSKGDFLRVSPSSETILGYRPDEMVGHSAIEFIFAPDLEPTRNEMRLARRGRSMRNFETRYVHRDGHPVTLTWTGVWSEPERRHFFIGRDMTEKIAADEQLRQAQKMEAIGQLTGGIAHDFNNMLTVITGTIDILADAVADKPQLAAIARMISEAAERGAELTGHLLAFARKQPLRPRPTDLNDLVASAGKLLRPVLGEQIDIEVSLERDAWPAIVDPTQLVSAIVNLAVNARDAMPDGGKLTLETGNVVLDEAYAQAHGEVRAGYYVLIAMTDSGTGIPESIRDRIFEPFFSTKDIGKGTGLGLSMVYGFVKQSNGHIKVYSEVGHGTTFKIYLPRSGDLDEGVEADAGDSAEVGSGTILVVEDDPLVRSYVTAQLHRLGYQTIPAVNAAEALALVDNGATFDLLFTDVIMSGPMNGRRLAEEMAKRVPGIKVLYTSGYTENAIVHQGRLDPGVLLLVKPYRKSDLARSIRQAITGPSMVSRERVGA